ncbi:hypothetical protein [Enterococcus sp. DIV0170]|uniref:hypothetical protein n=1 Tax=Enterococcus sp. DIV0170 TaxID=2774642 RepID=UPI003F298F12
MLPCYTIAQGISASSNQAVLLVNKNKLIVLYIHKLSDKVVQKNELNLAEISRSTLRNSLPFSKVWRFYYKEQKWIFRIPYIHPLRIIKTDFVDFLYELKSKGLLSND